MNYREKIRKAIECPQFGNEHYGEWGALTLEQRKYIKRLLDELDSADNYFKKVYLENKQLKDNWNKLKEDLKLILDYSFGEDASSWDKIYGEHAKATLKFMEELEQGSDDSNGRMEKR